TGFQTVEQREQTKQSAPKKQYLTSDTPLIKPINEFSKKAEPVIGQEYDNTPVLKSEDKVSAPQVDLFGEMTKASSTKSIADSQEKVIKHQLFEEEKEEEVEEQDAHGFNLKLSEPDVFASVAVAEESEHNATPQEIPQQVVVASSVDDNKTDE